MLIPSSFISWCSILTATVISSIFNVKNYGPIIMHTIPTQYVPFILGAIIITQIILMFMIKFSFF